MPDHPDYKARAIQVDDQAARSVTREMADGWRRLAESYRKLACDRQHQDDNRRGKINRRTAGETC